MNYGKPTQKTLELFRKTILDNTTQEHRDEILELKFGCNVEVKGIRSDNPGCENDIVVDNRIDELNRIRLGYYDLIPISKIINNDLLIVCIKFYFKKLYLKHLL